eukprot:scaffold172775_cov22-Tisochrysis_lutea.AAC.1
MGICVVNKGSKAGTHILRPAITRGFESSRLPVIPVIPAVLFQQCNVAVHECLHLTHTLAKSAKALP